MSEFFTEKAEDVLRAAKNTAKSENSPAVYSHHLLKALISVEGTPAYFQLKRSGIKPQDIRPLVCRKTSGNSVCLSPKVSAMIEMLKSEHKTVGTNEILSGLYSLKGTSASEYLYNLSLNNGVLENNGSDMPEYLEDSSHDGRFALSASEFINAHKNNAVPHAAVYSRHPNKTSVLLKYARNLCAGGKISACFGREREINEIADILLRKKKNNPCLIGEPGTGKTAAAEALAGKIAQGTAPKGLLGKTVYSLDVSALISGAKYRGDFEERVNALLNEVRGCREIILFIDEVHTVCGAGGAEGAVSLSDIIKPALSRGEISVIGATTRFEYEKYIEKDPALERRFSPVEIREPSQEETLTILRGAAKEYSEFHGVSYSEEAFEQSFALSEKYFPGRFQPDKSLDLLDLAGARFGRYGSGKGIAGDDVPIIASSEIRAVLRIPDNETGGEYAGKAVIRIKNGEDQTAFFDEAKKISSCYFGGNMIRIDCSEYADQTGVSKLIGAAPGYTGYEDSTSLCAKIRRRPVNVIFVSGFERASGEVKAVFSDILETKRIEDARGVLCDFGRVYFIFTVSVPKSGVIGFNSECGLNFEQVRRLLPEGFAERAEIRA